MTVRNERTGTDGPSRRTAYRHVAAAPDGPPGAGLARRSPALLAVTGSACISASAMFVKLSGVNAGTAAFLRCALALLVLVPLALRERRAFGRRPPRLAGFDLAAGALLGVDFVCWARSIHDLGSSIATVLLNIQIAVFPLLALAFGRVRPGRRYWWTLPLMLLGVALAGGAIGDPEPGSSPLTGLLYGTAAGVAFAGYLFLTRQGGIRRGRARGRTTRVRTREGRLARSSPGTDGSRPDGGGSHTVHPVCVSTLAAGLTSGVLGSLWTGIDPAPGWEPLGWLAVMALFGQVLALILLGPALARLAPATSSALLLLQPVLALLLGVLFLGERPTVTQFAGCALVVLAVWHTSRSAH